MSTTGKMERKLEHGSDRTKLLICLGDISSATTMKRRSGFKEFERSHLPKLDKNSSIEILRGVKSLDGHKLKLSDILMSLIVDRNAPEILREKGAYFFRVCLQKAFADEGTSVGKTKNDPASQDPFLLKIYVEFSSIVYSSLSPQSQNGNIAVEQAEEIRLILICTMREILSYILSMNTLSHIHGSESNDRDFSKHSTISEEDGMVLVHRKHLISATSLILEVFSKITLYDPYPEVKRECCAVIKFISQLFPSVIKRHSKSLLIPIVGKPLTMKDDENLPGSNAILETCRNAALPLSSSSKTYLIRHRHNKMRCTALVACVDILMPLMNTSIHHVYSIVEEQYRSEEINSIESLGEILTSHVLPSWEAFSAFDSSVPVRSTLADTVGKILLDGSSQICEMNNYIAHEPCRPRMKSTVPPFFRLLLLFLMCLSDQSQKVSKVAGKYYEKIGEICKNVCWPQDAQNKNDIVQTGFICTIGSNTIGILLMDARNNYLIEKRVRALETLALVLGLIKKESDVTDKKEIEWLFHQESIDEIIITLSSCVNNDEITLCDAALTCANAIGSFNDFCSSFLRTMLSAINSKPSVNIISEDINQHPKDSNMTVNHHLNFSTPRELASALRLLSGILLGMQSDNNEIHPEKNEVWLNSVKANGISNIFVCETIKETLNSSFELSFALLEACKSLVITAKNYPFLHSTNNTDVEEVSDNTFLVSVDNDLQASTLTNILCCCIYLLASPKEFGLHGQIMQLMEYVPNLAGNSRSMDELLNNYFRNILHCIHPDIVAASENDMKILLDKAHDSWIFAFEALVRASGGKVLGRHFSLVAPVLEYHLAASCTESKFQVKLAFMALFQSIVSEPSFPQEVLHPFIYKLLNTVLVPNLVWQVGSEASALRKVTAATLFSILNCGGITVDTLFALGPRMLPILRSNLGDDDSSIRELICSSLALIFELIPGALGEEAVNQLYPDIIRCFDDSNENIRYAACRTMQHFLKTAPTNHFKGTAINYITEQLFIHMDDPDPRFQTEVMKVLSVVIEMEPDVVSKNIVSARKSHRSTKFIDNLSSQIEKLHL